MLQAKRVEEKNAELARQREAKLSREASLLQLRLVEDTFAAANLSRLRQGKQLGVKSIIKKMCNPSVIFGDRYCIASKK